MFLSLEYAYKFYLDNFRVSIRYWLNSYPEAEVQIQAPTFGSCVALGELFNLSVFPQFIVSKNRITVRVTL